MSRCRNRPQDTSQLTSHAHGRDRMSKMFQSNPPLDPKLFSSTKFFATRQVRMTGRRIRPQDTSHLTMHAHSLNRQSKVCKLDAPLDPKLFTMKFFASRQVRMLGGLIEPPDTVNPTLHAHGTDSQSWSCKLNVSLDPKLFGRTNFLHDGKFECLGVATGLKMHHIRHRMHMA